MNKTTNFNLLKPEGHERYNIDEFNSNMEIIDKRMYNNMQGIQSSENHIANQNNPHHVSKDQVGLGNVDNTSDSEKPVSIQQQQALDAKQNILEYDSAPTENSMKMVRSGGIFNFVKNLFSAFKGANTTTAGEEGLVPPPSAGAANRFLRSDGKWSTVSKGNVGLSNVENVKAVSTEANQELSEVEKANARNNIGAGISNFDGDFFSLHNTPTWIKRTTKPNYSAEEVGTYSKAEVDALLGEVDVNSIPIASSSTNGLMSKESVQKLESVDDYPLQNSEHLIQSGGVYKAFQDIFQPFSPPSNGRKGSSGVVPSPPESEKTLFLSSQGDWQEPSKAITEPFSVGNAGLVPAPTSMDSNKFLRADGTWGIPAGSGTSVVTDPGLARKYYASKEFVDNSLHWIFGAEIIATITLNSRGERVWTFTASDTSKNSDGIAIPNAASQYNIIPLQIVNTIEGETYSTYCCICNKSTQNILCDTPYSDSLISDTLEQVSLLEFFQSLLSSVLQDYVRTSTFEESMSDILNGRPVQ